MSTSAAVTKVTESVKESLLGTDLANDEQLSANTKATFVKYAKKDESTGELYMGEEEFVNAVAPADEDYVSHCTDWC